MLLVGSLVVRAVLPHDVTAVVQDIDRDGVIAVELDGRTERLRLAHVELGGYEERCLGADAVDRLKGLLPPGTTVTLVHGTENPQDGAYVTSLLVDDVLIDEEMAATGLTKPIPVPYDSERTAEIRAAHSQAEADEVGYFDPSILCSPAALVDTYEATVQEFADESAAAVLSQDVDALDEALAAHAAVTAAHAYLRQVLWDDVDAFPATVLNIVALNELRGRTNIGVVATNKALTDAENALRAAEAARQAEAARVAEAARQAEAARVAEVEAARQAEAERQAAAQRQQSASPPRSSSGGSSSGGSSGYTGCRAYAPGGKSWKPIPCP